MSENDFNAVQRIVGLLDLTSLGDDDTPEVIADLCRRAQTPYGPVAAVCVWPRFVQTARQQLGDDKIRVAAVTNFPAGNDDVASSVRETEAAVALGANEIDVVFPYRAWLSGNHKVGDRLVRACKAVCEDQVLLKVILETGELATANEINAVAHCALDAGADFIKTSTGKTAIAATMQAAELMLQAIKLHGSGGFKAAGGIRDLPTAAAFVELADRIMGSGWVNAGTFRFGASGLLESLLNVLGDQGEINSGSC